MPHSKSIHAYPDVQALYEKAMASEKGIKIVLKTTQEAYQLWGRLHKFRKIDRLENSRIYPADHALHARSAYDVLSVRWRSPQVEVKIVKIGEQEFNVEEL